MSDEATIAPVNLVILFDNADRPTLTALDNQLRPLETAKLANIWHRDRIHPGEHSDSLFDNALKRAHIVLFIMSADFIASCGDSLAERFEHWRASQVKIVSVLARPCMMDFSFKGVTSLPKDDSPIVEGGAINEARLFSVVKAIRTVVEEAARRRDNRKTPMIDISVMQTLARMERERYELERRLAQKVEQPPQPAAAIVAPSLALRIARLQGALDQETPGSDPDSIAAASETIERAIVRLRAATRRERLLRAACVLLGVAVVLLGSRILLPVPVAQVAALSPSSADQRGSNVATADTLNTDRIAPAEPTTSPTEKGDQQGEPMPSAEPQPDAAPTTTATTAPATSSSATKPCKREGQSCATSYECCVKLKCSSENLQCEQSQ